MKYLKYFTNESDYQTFKDSEECILPNVSYTEDSNLYYNPTASPVVPYSPNVVCTYYTSDPYTNVSLVSYYGWNGFTNMIIDGVKMDIAAEYVFESSGLHTVEFILYDEKTLGYSSFEDCINLTSVVIPDSITSIGVGAFGGFSSLTSVIISDSVTSIGGSAFNGCSALTEITCNAAIAPTLQDKYVFERIAENGVLKVPAGSDYSSWLSDDRCYLGYYNWTVEYI